MNSDQVQRIYLDELGDRNQQPIGINLMQLTIASDEAMAEQAKQLIERVQLEETDTSSEKRNHRYYHHNCCLQVFFVE